MTAIYLLDDDGEPYARATLDEIERGSRAPDARVQRDGRWFEFGTLHVANRGAEDEHSYTQGLTTEELELAYINRTREGR